MPKSTSWTKATLNSKKIKFVALAVTELCLSDGISQSVTTLYIYFFKFCSILLKTFQVDLKACLGLVLPNQYCLIVVWESEASFWVIPLTLLCFLMV